jgi:hypothetical protein
MRKLLVVTLLLASVAVIGCATTYPPANLVAFGKTWELIGVNSNDYSQHFCDPQKTIVSNGIVRTEWRVVDTIGYELVGEFEVDCARNQVRSYDGVRYDKYYRYVGSEPGMPWTPIPYNSVMSVFAQRYCR